RGHPGHLPRPAHRLGRRAQRTPSLRRTAPSSPHRHRGRSRGPSGRAALAAAPVLRGTRRAPPGARRSSACTMPAAIRGSGTIREEHDVSAHRLRTTTRVAAGLAAVALTATACGGDDPENTGTSAAGTGDDCNSVTL